MTVKFWVVTTNDENGVESFVFWDKAKAVEMLDAQLRPSWARRYPETPYPDDWQKAYEVLCDDINSGFIDSYGMDEHQVPQVRCNNCMSVFDSDDDLELLPDGKEWFKGCPKCKTDGYLMDLEV